MNVLRTKIQGKAKNHIDILVDQQSFWDHKTFEYRLEPWFSLLEHINHSCRSCMESYKRITSNRFELENWYNLSNKHLIVAAFLDDMAHLAETYQPFWTMKPLIPDIIKARNLQYWLAEHIKLRDRSNDK